MDNVVASLLSDVAQYKYNPVGLQRAVVGLIPAVSNGELDVVDVSNPVVLALETCAILTAGFMTENQTTTRLQYPYSAQTIEDLYPHMSDKDFVDRFAVPTDTDFIFFFDYDELVSKLVEDPNDNGILKVTIPRNTYVTVADTVFSFEYPVEIRQLQHGGLQIVYDVSEVSPLTTLSTNVIPWSTVKGPQGQNYLAFVVNLKQFKITSRTFPVTVSTGFKVNVAFSDQYYYCRVWIDNGTAAAVRYTEVQTTHTDEVYDITIVTAVLQVLNGVLSVKIPQVYLTTGLLTKSLRIDVYQTKGPLTMSLVNYRADQFVVTYNALNDSENDIFVAPLNTIHDNQVQSVKQVSGGKDAMTFDELRLRMVQNAIGSPSLPITNTQIESALSRAGYDIVKNIDNITNRTFLATRKMPDPTASELLTAAAAGICTLVTKLTDAVTISTVIDNGDLITIKPNTLYKVVGSQLLLVNDAETELLTALTPDQLAIAVNAQSYMYTPFHYVLDSSNNEFNVRPYYLDVPIINSKSFIAENDTTLLQVSTNAFSIFRTTTGYIIEISTTSSDAFKALDDSVVHVQLSYIPPGDTDRAYVLGTQVAKDATTSERIYHFVIDTNYAIDSDNQMDITSFQMYDLNPKTLKIPLTQIFDVLYSTDTPKGPDYMVSVMNAALGFFQLPNNTYAVTQEQLNVTMGYYLGSLWARARSVTSDADYAKYTVDVPALYEADVYVTDPVTGSAFTVGSDGKLVYTIAHHKNDPVLDTNGQPVIKWRVGDIKLDAYNNPIVVNNRSMVRQLDMFMIEAPYKFATNAVTIAYRQQLTNTVVSWLTDDLPNMDNNLLEQTELFYYPTTTIGQVDVIFGAGLQTTIDSSQTFSVTLYVSSNVYKNADLRAAITAQTIKTIAAGLNNVKVSISDISDALKAQYKDDVLSIDLKGLAGVANLNVVTLIDGSKKLSLKKLLVARNDETLGLQEGVSVDYVLHQQTGS